MTVLSGRRSRRAQVAALALITGLLGPGAAGVARAEAEDGDAGFSIGLRTGYGLPLGSYAKVRTLAGVRDEDVNAIADDAYGVIPLWLDLGYRLTPHWLIGVYGVYGLVLPKTAPAIDPLSGGCPEGFDCAATGVRLGLQAQYSFSPDEPLQPWLGLGLGYEWISTEIEGVLFGQSFEVESAHSGPDLLQLSAGLDLELVPDVAFGPYATVSGLRYTSCSVTLNGQKSSCELDEGAWHGWLLVGLRGAFAF